ncbi:hypothetical protein TrLO_g2379 [Triparma laevis f. longispina]|uniref:Acetyl-CoA C-acetyltransferase n=1 Tax=Triparma laevis f. longispina TaxID=1714387 RepID=A0A9W7EA31_9STRA|nr:hypothetical protein TrLO_g2379 [Triparma laevis f. longispina]
MSSIARPVIVSFKRTAIAPFNGSLSSVGAPALASATISSQLASLAESSSGKFTAESIVDVTLGNVVSSGIGQAPARQAWKGAGGHNGGQCTTINKVCASGMKAAMYASQNIMLGSGPQLAGGFESMSNIPHYLPAMRTGMKLGPSQVIDGIINDGLWDVYNNQHMGMCGEKCAEDYGITREDQDAYAVESYRRANTAIEAGKFKDEIADVTVKSRRGDTVVNEDAEPTNFNVDKMGSLRAAFKKENGTVTAANASSLNDGAASMVMMSEEDAAAFGLTPIARVLGFGDAEQAPEDFTTAPALAVPRALAHAGVSLSDVDYHEINEAFSVVALANMKLMDLDHSRVNVNGGAVALGHPIGCSGARIIGTLINVLKQNDATIGCASICNGGGGASALIVERM